MCPAPVPGPPGNGTLAIPRHAPHEVTTNAAATNTNPRQPTRASPKPRRLIATRPLQPDTHPQAAGPQAAAAPTNPPAPAPEPPPPAAPAPDQAADHTG